MLSPSKHEDRAERQTGTAFAIPGATSGSFSTSFSFSRAAAASRCLFHIEA